MKGLSVNSMLLELSLDTSIVDNMTKGSMPSADKLVPIARFLGVSVGYISGENVPAAPEGEQPVMKLIEELTENSQDLSEEEADEVKEFLAFVKSKRTR